MQNLVIPKNEKNMVAYHNERGQHLFELTKQMSTDNYVLYKVIGNKLQKLGKGKNPMELEEKFKVIEIIRR